MIKSSTGLAAKMMVTGSFISIMNLCKIKVFGGTVAENADAAETGTLLVTITNNDTGTGLTWEATAVGRAAVKKTTETWSGTAVAGTATPATHFRIVAAGDTGALSTTEARVQGSVGNVAGVDLFLTNPNITTSDIKTLAAFSVTLPTN